MEGCSSDIPPVKGLRHVGEGCIGKRWGAGVAVVFYVCICLNCIVYHHGQIKGFLFSVDILVNS